MTEASTDVTGRAVRFDVDRSQQRGMEARCLEDELGRRDRIGRSQGLALLLARGVVVVAEVEVFK